jgi:signal transduction histidine kinase
MMPAMPSPVSTTSERRGTRTRGAEALDDPFLARVVHELGQPLHTIDGALRVLGRSPLRVEQSAALEIAERQTAHARRVLAELVEAIRTRRRMFSMSADEIDLRRVLRDTAWQLAPSARDAGLKLTLALGTSPLKVRGDAARLHQVFSNLLANAIRVTPRDGRISVLAGRVGRSALVKVQDTGPGIRREERRRIFAPFRGTERRGGLGLGLTIAREIVDAHDGDIAVKSAAPKRGAEFVVTFPLLRTLPGSPRRRKTDPPLTT